MVGIRLPRPLEERLSAYEARVTKKTPGFVQTSTSDVLRHVIQAGLDALESSGDLSTRCAALGQRVGLLEEMLRAWEGRATDAERGVAGLAKAREETRRLLDAGRRQ